MIVLLGWGWFIFYPVLLGGINDAELVTLKLFPSSVYTIPCINHGNVIYPVGFDEKKGVITFKSPVFSEAISVSDFSGIKFCIYDTAGSISIVKNKNVNEGGFSIDSKMGSFVSFVTVKSKHNCKISGVYGNISVFECKGLGGKKMLRAIDLETGGIAERAKVDERDMVLGFLNKGFK